MLFYAYFKSYKRNVRVSYAYTGESGILVNDDFGRFYYLCHDPILGFELCDKPNQFVLSSEDEIYELIDEPFAKV